MLYKRGTVKCVEQVSAITSHSDSCTQVAHRVTLQPGPKNPLGHLRVACLFRVAQETDAVACGETSRWTPDFLEAMISQVLNDQVRVLVGVFAVAEDQVKLFAQECGATNMQPFLQLFWDSVRREHMLFTVYGFVFGPCAVIKQAPQDDSPWLSRSGLPDLSVPLISCRDYPRWSHIKQRSGAGSSNDQRSGAADRMPELFACGTKPANMKKWIPGVHQLLLFIGKQRRGQKSARDHDKERAARSRASGDARRSGGEWQKWQDRGQ